jgi:hypothetical protein
MEITEIEASYARKVQLDQFEPIEHRVTMTAVLGESEDADEAYDALAEQAEDAVEREIARRITQKKLADESDDDE